MMSIDALARIRAPRAAMTVALSTTLPFLAGAAQSPQQLSREIVAARVDSIVRAYMVEKGPASVSVAVSRGHEVLFQRAYGMADIATKRPAAPGMVYKLGSISKQFTAVLLLRQVERGKLALTDSIGRYLTTGLRPEWRPITIEQLLNHTAGLPRDLTREGPNDEGASTGTMIAWAARDTVLFAPGTKYSYSNVGYLLLGALVETLYGKPYGAAFQEEIARPLGLRTLGWCPEQQGKDTLMATGYQYLGPGQHELPVYGHTSKSLGMGGLCSSAGDLAAWNRALHGGRVVSPATYAAMTTARGAARGYGFGLQFSVIEGMSAIYHFGGTIGFTGQNAWFPAESLSVTVLFGSSGGNGFPTNLAVPIARAVSAAPKR